MKCFVLPTTPHQSTTSCRDLVIQPSRRSMTKSPRPRDRCIRASYRTMPFQKYKSTSPKHGGTGKEWTMEAGWSSISFVGCEYRVNRAECRLCLVKLGVIQREDYSFLVLGMFWKYIQVMRYLQSTYWLEPAGSHGVWGLDDYQFLPFLWGAGQLKGMFDVERADAGHKHLKPKCIHDPEVLEAFSTQYMYLSCISFINSIKTASLRWHSPMLDDISVVKTWDKVNSGMMKMYQAEVLGKLPVMQHALFGSILPFPTPEEDPELRKALEEEAVPEPDAHGHIHVKGEPGWTMDCCGIPGEPKCGKADDSAIGLCRIYLSVRHQAYTFRLDSDDVLSTCCSIYANLTLLQRSLLKLSSCCDSLHPCLHLAPQSLRIHLLLRQHHVVFQPQLRRHCLKVPTSESLGHRKLQHHRIPRRQKHRQP